MLNMNMSFEQSKSLVQGIPHGRASNAIGRHWCSGGRSGVTAQSVCWLFCWAKTGQNSHKAALEARRIFDRIFSLSYEQVDRLLDHEWARVARYAPGDIEAEFHAMVS